MLTRGLRCDKSGSGARQRASLPLGAVGVAGMTLVVGLGVLKDKTVGSLQAVGTLLHTVGPIFEVEALHTLVRTLDEHHGCNPEMNWGGE